MNTENITSAALSNFWGSQEFYRHWISRSLVYTEGCEFLNATLKVNLEKKSAVLIFDDGNDNVLAKQEIGYTNFPLPEIVFYVESNGEGKTMMLTSER